MEPILNVIGTLTQMFTPYTLALVLFAPISYRYIDLLLLCCVNACVYFIIAYISPGYIQAGDLVVSNLYAKISIDAAVHWLPLVVIYLLYGSFYKNKALPKVHALMMYGIYLLTVKYKDVYHHDTTWMLIIGGFMGLFLEWAIV